MTEGERQDVRDRVATRRIAYLDACGRFVTAACPAIRGICLTVAAAIGLHGVVGW